MIFGIKRTTFFILVLLTLLVCLTFGIVLLTVLDQSSQVSQRVPTVGRTPSKVFLQPELTPVEQLQSNQPGTTSTPEATVMSTATRAIETPYTAIASATLQLTTTATELPTITITPEPGMCSRFSLTFVNATSNIGLWRLSNDNSTPAMITQIELSWPKANEVIFNAFLNGRVIWSGGDLVPPSFMTTWFGDPSDRIVEGNTRLEFLFGTSAVSSGYDLQLDFDNGCTVSTSN